MNAWILALSFSLLIAGPATAGSYTITTTPDQDATVADRAKIVNAARARIKGTPQAELTSAQMLQQAVDQLIEQWDAQLSATEDTKPWADKSAAARRRHCAKLGLDPCPAAKK